MEYSNSNIEMPSRPQQTTAPGRSGVGPSRSRADSQQAGAPDNDKGRKVVMAQWSRHLESIIDTVALDINRQKPEHTTH